ncbi:MAG: hypothetical protein MK098_11000 [Marinovum sp.]|nr:hypothetical protein [Marinovum sp.]
MSDAAKNVEIEDVLASIRRLVSDEVAQELSRKDAGEAAAATPQPVSTPAEPLAKSEPEALVLTPSLRVADSPKTKEPTAFETEIAEQDDEDSTAHAALLQAVADHVAASQEGSDDMAFAKEMSDADPDIRETADAIETIEAVDDDADSRTLTVVADQSVLDNQVEESFFDEATSEDEDIIDVSLLMQPHADSQESVEDPASEDEDASSASSEGSLEEKIARLETMIGRSESGFEPERAVAVEPIDWQDLSETDVAKATEDNSQATVLDIVDMADEAETEHAPVSPADDPAVVNDAGVDLLADPSDVMLDEDMLRDMVTAIVREELQGSLGERITRNVRKLVRREIHRALASQELD